MCLAPCAHVCRTYFFCGAVSWSTSTGDPPLLTLLPRHLAPWHTATGALIIAHNPSLLALFSDRYLAFAATTNATVSEQYPSTRALASNETADLDLVVHGSLIIADNAELVTLVGLVSVATLLHPSHAPRTHLTHCPRTLSLPPLLVPLLSVSLPPLSLSPTHPCACAYVRMCAVAVVVSWKRG